MIGAAGVQHLVSYSLLSLKVLRLQHTGIDDSALSFQAQGQWPALQFWTYLGTSLALHGFRIWYKAVGLCSTHCICQIKV